MVRANPPAVRTCCDSLRYESHVLKPLHASTSSLRWSAKSAYLEDGETTTVRKGVEHCGGAAKSLRVAPVVHDSQTTEQTFRGIAVEGPQRKGCRVMDRLERRMGAAASSTGAFEFSILGKACTKDNHWHVLRYNLFPRSDGDCCRIDTAARYLRLLVDVSQNKDELRLKCI